MLAGIWGIVPPREANGASAPFGCDTAQGLHEHLASYWIVNGMGAPSMGEIEDRLSKALLAIVNDVIGATVGDELAFLVGARGSDHRSPENLADFHRRQSNPAGRTMREQGFTSLHIKQMRPGQRRQGGDIRRRQANRQMKRDGIGKRIDPDLSVLCVQLGFMRLSAYTFTQSIHFQSLINSLVSYLITGSAGSYGSRDEHFSADAPAVLW